MAVAALTALLLQACSACDSKNGASPTSNETASAPPSTADVGPMVNATPEQNDSASGTPDAGAFDARDGALEVRDDSGATSPPDVLRIIGSETIESSQLAWLEAPKRSLRSDAGANPIGPCSWFAETHVPKIVRPRLLQIEDPTRKKTVEEFQEAHVQNLTDALSKAICINDGDAAWVLHLEQIEANSGSEGMPQRDSYQFSLRVGRIEPEEASFRLTLSAPFVPWPKVMSAVVRSDEYMRVADLSLRPLSASELPIEDGGHPAPVVEFTGNLFHHICSPDGDPPPESAKLHFAWTRGMVRWTPPPRVRRPLKPQGAGL